jgi:hypothetical protein
VIVQIFCDICRELLPLFLRVICDERRVLACKIFLYLGKNFGKLLFVASGVVKQCDVTDERLKPKETRKFIDNSFRDGVLKTTGTDIDKLMPPVSRFGDSHRAEKKQTIVERLNAFFERFFGIG